VSTSTYSPKEYKDVSDFMKKLIRQGVDPGLFCTELDENVPSFEKAECEKIIKNSSNSFIVLGRDRPQSLASGAGGSGFSAAGMIDLVVGRGAVFSANPKNEDLTPADLIGPNFAADAARIYITQKSLDIDEYFGFANTKTDSYGKSAVGIKADHTRIIARESVRIYCGPGAFSGERETNCNGVTLDPPRIEIIAADEGKLQPAVLGNNLVEYLKDNNELQRSLISAVQKIFTQLTAINAGLAGLTFGSPPFSTNLIEDFNQVMNSIVLNLNTHFNEINCLNAMIMPGASPILSNSVFIT